MSDCLAVSRAVLAPHAVRQMDAVLTCRQRQGLRRSHAFVTCICDMQPSACAGNLLFRAGRLAQAEKALLRSVWLDKGDSTALLDLGHLLARQRRHSQARVRFQQANTPSCLAAVPACAAPWLHLLPLKPLSFRAQGPSRLHNAPKESLTRADAAGVRLGSVPRG